MGRTIVWSVGSAAVTEILKSRGLQRLGGYFPHREVQGKVGVPGKSKALLWVTPRGPVLAPWLRQKLLAALFPATGKGAQGGQGTRPCF